MWFKFVQNLVNVGYFIFEMCITLIPMEYVQMIIPIYYMLYFIIMLPSVQVYSFFESAS